MQSIPRILLIMLLLCCRADMFAQQQFSPSNYLIVSVDSLAKMFYEGQWKDGIIDSTTKSLYPPFWYKQKEQEKILGIVTAGVACQPICTYYELPDSTLWIVVSVSEIDNMSMLPPEKCWIYQTKNKRIISGTFTMKNMYRTWTCKFELSEKEIKGFIDKFYLYKAYVR